MKNTTLLTFAVLSIITLCPVLAFGQTEQEIEEKYGKPLKTYKMSSCIYMIPQYASDGQIVSATLYCSRISIDGNDFPGVHGPATLPWGELKKVLDDIIPKSERGKLNQAYEDDIYGIRSATYNYEKVSVNFTSFSRENDVSVGTFNLGPQIPEEQQVVIKKVPLSKAFQEITDEFKGEIARSSEFVQIIWLSRNEKRISSRD